MWIWSVVLLFSVSPDFGSSLQDKAQAGSNSISNSSKKCPTSSWSLLLDQVTKKVWNGDGDDDDDDDDDDDGRRTKKHQHAFNRLGKKRTSVKQSFKRSKIWFLLNIAKQKTNFTFFSFRRSLFETCPRCLRHYGEGDRSLNAKSALSVRSWVRIPTGVSFQHCVLKNVINGFGIVLLLII